MDAYNNPGLAMIARHMNEELASGCQLAVGKVVTHPEHGRVKIMSGAFLVGGRVSNFWDWQKIGEDGKPYGKTYSGYGWV